MTLDADVLAKLAAPTIAAMITLAIKAYTSAKPKIVAWLGHISIFKLDAASRLQVVAVIPDGDAEARARHHSVHAHSLIVRNVGGKTANQVRVSHYMWPDHVSVHPPVNYTIERNPEGSADIIFPVLVPGEQVTLSYLYDPSLSFNLITAGLKSDEGMGRIVDAPTMHKPSIWRMAVVLTLAFVGLSLVIYWIVLWAIALLKVSG